MATTDLWGELPAPNNELPITSARLAEIFHVTVQLILRIIKDNRDNLFDNVQAGKGKYDLCKFAYAYSQYQKRTGEQSITRRPKDYPEEAYDNNYDSNCDLDIGYERARHYKAQVDKLELANKEKMLQIFGLNRRAHCNSLMLFAKKNMQPRIA